MVEREGLDFDLAPVDRKLEGEEDLHSTVVEGEGCG